MWQRFTERSRRVIFFAQEEAGELNKNDVDSEHLLLALLREEGVASAILTRMGMSVQTVQERIRAHATRGGKGDIKADMLLTARLKKVIDFAFDEARLLDDHTIDQEHLLMGVIREGSGLTGEVFREMEVDVDRAREAVAVYRQNAPTEAIDKPTATEEDKRNTSKRDWTRFTERTRRIVFFAQEEAAALGEKFVSTEHLLLGLLRESDTTAYKVLVRIGLSPDAIRTELQRQVAGRANDTSEDVQLTPRAKRVIDLAYDESRQLGSVYIGTEHILLGLIREGEGLAGRVLARFGIELSATQKAIRELQAGESGVVISTDARLGDLGTLADADRDSLEIAIDRTAHDALQAAFAARDDHGYRELYATGKFFLVPTNSESKLLETGVGESLRVRILSGDQTGESGWVNARVWRRTGADARPFPPAVSPDDFPTIRFE